MYGGGIQNSNLTIYKVPPPARAKSSDAISMTRFY